MATACRAFLAPAVGVTQSKEADMTTAKLTLSDLNQFTGSENWYRHGLNRNVTYTDGAQYLAEKGGAYWLLDAIAICQLHEKRVTAEEFQIWKLPVREDRTAPLVSADAHP